LLSEEGIQQGDPLGPLLCCLAIHGVLQEIGSEFLTGYLDDIGIGDYVTKITADILKIEETAAKLGLVLKR
jgi:hypothetical protein